MQNLKALTFKQLRALVSVAEHGTIAAAANSLSLSDRKSTRLNSSHT